MTVEECPQLELSDRAKFDEQGFLIVRNALAPSHVEQLRAAIARACDLDLHLPETWSSRFIGRNGCVNLFHDQSQWDARQSPINYNAFASVLKSTRLWVSIDRAKLQLPTTWGEKSGQAESFIHWDIDLRRAPAELMVQGVLCLSDASPEHGGFQCVPGFHRDARRLAAKKSWNPWCAAAHFGSGDIHVVNAAEGDLIIWNSLLPHGAGTNQSDRPRIAQFVRMFHAAPDNQDLVARRQAIWTHRHSPGGTRSLDEPAPPAKLTALGRRLVGVDRWD